jgi:hypothetical protein
MWNGFDARLKVNLTSGVSHKDLGKREPVSCFALPPALAGFFVSCVMAPAARATEPAYGSTSQGCSQEASGRRRLRSGK